MGKAARDNDAWKNDAWESAVWKNAVWENNTRYMALPCNAMPRWLCHRIQSSTEGVPMSRSRYKFCESHYPHFMTCTIVAWLPVFATPKFADIVFNSWRFLQAEREIDIIAYVVLENHLHWIAVGPELGKRVNEFKSFTARRIIDSMQQMKYETLLQELAFFKKREKHDQEYQLWQQGSHPQVIEDEKVMIQKIEYIHNNPVKRGYVADPVHWRYSSARNYSGLEGLLDVCDQWY
jgi:REP element-mobilizing transposase RayT